MTHVPAAEAIVLQEFANGIRPESDSMNDDVWYACYGSNLRRSRFMCYILGGTPKGASAANPGARNTTPPSDARPFRLPHRLYFAERSARWQHLGIAFLETSRSARYSALSRIYRLTRKQFLDVFAQENRLPLGEASIDFAELHRRGSLVVSESLYGNCLYVADVDGLPVYSFTRQADVAPSARVPPGEAYLKTIIMGVLETFPGLDAMRDLVPYLTQATSGEISQPLLRKWTVACMRQA